LNPWLVRVVSNGQPFTSYWQQVYSLKKPINQVANPTSDDARKVAPSRADSRFALGFHP